MAVDQDTQQMLGTEPAPYDLDLSWMESTGPSAAFGRSRAGAA